ncbi:G-patch domain-containing protein 1 [Picochlorum sp. SENEW3]|nr:G-patch domain-containing protein 1 [Picochlorum sp. SENEW3]
MGSEANMVGTRYQGVQKESAGYKLLKSMGWNEGEGLGASKQGIKEHIRVKKKFENWGVGAVESHDRARDWSNNMSEFHRVLSSLSEIMSKHAGSSSSSSEEDDDDTVVASPKKSKFAEGEARKSKKKKDGKKRKAGKKKDSKKEEKKKASHIGRFKRREHAKMVKGYSSSDLAAILGEDPFSKQAELMAQGATDADGNAKQESTSHEEDIEEEKIDVVVESKSNKHEYVVPEDRWWSNYFVRGPRAGSKREKSSIRKTKGFSEQDQENLFTSAHDGATTGRIGLGRSSMPKKVAGVRWQGTKTRLDDDSDNEQGENEKECSSTDDDDNDVQIKIVMPPKKKARQSGDTSNQVIAGILEHLLSQETSKSMKMKSLIKGAVKHLQKDATITTKSKRLKVQITQCLESQQGSVFAIKGKVVSLCQ